MGFLREVVMTQRPPLGSGYGGESGPPGAPLPPPVPLEYAAPIQPEGPDIRKVAEMQRAIMFCILGEVCAGVARVAFHANGLASLELITSLIYLAVVVIAVVCIFKLALGLYSTTSGVVLGLLTLIPLVGFIVLLVVNSKATKVLRVHGLHVGLMGAKLPPAGKA
jgi:hypothetical protein